MFSCQPTVGLTVAETMPSRENIQMLQMLLARLERVSVDSYWAHRASGVRGSLLRTLELLEAGEGVNPAVMQSTVDQAFRILERAAPTVGAHHGAPCGAQRHLLGSPLGDGPG
jgi:hypothetical protein